MTRRQRGIYRTKLLLLVLPAGTWLHALAVSAQLDWTPHASNPVFVRGAVPDWDADLVLTPTVVLTGDTLRMWYSGGADIQNPSTAAIGEWNRDTMLPGPVIKEDGVYKMWFSGGVGGVTFASPNIRTGIGYATSIDGINWSIYDNPATTAAPFQFSDAVLFHGDSGDWDAHEMFTPSVLRTETGYEMWYSGWEYGSDQHIGYATSGGDVA
jgi:hypothetical protein